MVITGNNEDNDDEKDDNDYDQSERNTVCLFETRQPHYEVLFTVN